MFTKMLFGGKHTSLTICCFWKSFAILLIITISVTNSVTKRSTTTLLNGKHLKALWSRRGGIFNESYVGPQNGGVALEYLAKRFNFTYTYLNYTPKSNTGMFVDYIVSWEADVATHDALLTPARYQLVEMISCINSKMDFLIPVPKSTANIDALGKPFQQMVWILLLLSVIFVSFALHVVQWLTTSLSHLQPKPKQRHGFKAVSDANKKYQESFNSHDRNMKRAAGNIYFYIIGLLVSQGGPCIWKGLAYRVVVGVWCLAAFVLLQAYNSLLITYIIAPNNPPLIETVHDVVKKPDVQFVVEKNRGMDRFILNSNEKEGIFKELRNRLNKYPNSLCTKMDCIAMVKNGSKVVFGQGSQLALEAIIHDCNKFGQSNMRLAKEGYFPFLVGWMFPKGTPYRNHFAIGLLELEENGLLRIWEKWFRRIPSNCLENTSQTRMQEIKQPSRVKNPSLSLMNLTGAFLILLVGYTLALMVFFGENISYFLPLKI